MRGHTLTNISVTGYTLTTHTSLVTHSRNLWFTFLTEREIERDAYMFP